MYWIYLILAGLSEIVWAYGLKLSHGFTEPVWSAITVFFMFISFFLFAKAMKAISIGTAYAVFTGIGAAGTAVVGILFLGEEINILKTLSLFVLIAGITGLKLIGEGKNRKEEKIC
ncbi:MAG: multidrug efflux SMR transporter [Tannerellaceae bacterium]|nr:multidrug efflux SMR transporter [Tannerellaceae bacterium]